MSADDGYILRKKENGNYVLHHFFASGDEYPPINSDPIIEDQNIGLVIEKFNDRERSGYPSEYGLRTSF